MKFSKTKIKEHCETFSGGFPPFRDRGSSILSTSSFYLVGWEF